ncbi:hypothetical protein V6Z12_A01G048900 [Gossypium hirsutum]
MIIMLTLKALCKIMVQKFGGGLNDEDFVMVSKFRSYSS